ncbi:MAG: 7-cyano-7-deazaguanine synthase [Acidimicrobiales bacterium]
MSDRRGGSGSLILLSGGVDSTALASICHPDAALFIDYGQRPAPAERRAATVVSGLLEVPLLEVAVDLRPIGAGLLLDEVPIQNSSSPEWWPFRNQLLVSIAASIAIRHGYIDLIVGTVSGDGSRHADGTLEFYEALDKCVRIQEGGVSVRVPGIRETTEQLVVRSGLGEDILGWTISCHRSELPCGDCPGCWKRARVMKNLGILQGNLYTESP